MRKLPSRWLKNLLAIAILGILTAVLYGQLAAGFSTQAQVFNTVWDTVNTQFFDSNFNDVDWSAMKLKYKAQAIQAPTQAKRADVINQMLAELKTSHTHLYTPEEPAYYQLLGIFYPRSPEVREQLPGKFPNDIVQYQGLGLVTQEFKGKRFIKAIIEGSPAAKAGLKIGDRILSLDDKPYDPAQIISAPSSQVITLKIQTSAQPDSQKEVTLTPKQFKAQQMFLDSMDDSIEILQEEGKRVGYIHIWSYAGDQYQQKLEEELLYGRLKKADALILDLRDGWGGAMPNYLNIFSAEGPSFTAFSRGGRENTYDSYWKKPVVMLVNEGTRSGKEILAYGFQEYNIGPVIGNQTPGAVVAGRAFIMPDDSLLYVAVADVLVDGKTRLEGVGIRPDIEVPFAIEYAHGNDPQKKRAIETALKLAQKRNATS